MNDWRIGWVNKCIEEYPKKISSLMKIRMLRGAQKYNLENWASNRRTTDELIEELVDSINYVHAIETERFYLYDLLEKCAGENLNEELKEEINIAILRR